MAEVAGDWLNPNADAQRDEQRRKAVEFAQHYVEAFQRNPAGRIILDHWTRALARKRVPVTATIQEYAAVEAVRAFVEDINAQLQLAQTEGK